MTNKLLIPTLILLILSIVGYIVGYAHNISHLTNWSPEVGGATLVTLFIILYNFLNDK